MKRLLLIFLLIMGLFLAACSPAPAQAPTPITPNATANIPTASVSNTPASTQTPVPTSTATAQPRQSWAPAGPNLENFGPGINPLTGLEVSDPALLNLPAVLVSISNMPPTARPQAGLSFAPWVYELFIGEGTTRFMSVFYGTLPRRIPNPTGTCPASNATDKPTGNWIGNRVWLDENNNGTQDPWEAGLGGVCVSLADSGGQVLSTTGTDSNGYFAFDAAGLQPAAHYTLRFELPAFTRFTLANIGNDDQDSDADPITGQVDFIYQGKTDASLDAGLALTSEPTPSYSPADIAPARTYVGPIRSGRLTYNDFKTMYPASCLVYASAGNGIRQQLKGCDIIFGEQPGVSPNTALLDVNHLEELAQQSKIPGQPVNYSGHLFDHQPPAGGENATSLWTYFHAFSQAFWQYDPVSGAYLRQTDGGDGLGIFHADSDRLTGRQLAFENIAIIMADYNVFRHGQYDIGLCCGFEGFAFVFRDGQMYKVRWSTNNGAWEQKTGLLRPLHFTTTDKQPFALKPGRTWVSVMTINSVMKNLNNGNWQAFFVMPNDYAPAK